MSNVRPRIVVVAAFEACSERVLWVNGMPIWSPALLRSYERRHRAATLPLYVATQLLAGLYTDDRLPARALRKLALSAGAHVPPLRRMVVEGLTAANDDRRQARKRAGR